MCSGRDGAHSIARRTSRLSIDRVQQKIVEHEVEVPVPMVQEEVVYVPKIIPQERIVEEIVEQVVRSSRFLRCRSR